MYLLMGGKFNACKRNPQQLADLYQSSLREEKMTIDKQKILVCKHNISYAIDARPYLV